MKPFRRFVLFPVIAVSLAIFSCASGAEEQKGASWESLFNGKDLTGWKVMDDATFVITNGNLRLVKGNGWLRTLKQFTNFIFEAEWCALESGYDSGFLIRAGMEGRPWPTNAWQINLKSSALGGL